MLLRDTLRFTLASIRDAIDKAIATPSAIETETETETEADPEKDDYSPRGGGGAAAGTAAAAAAANFTGCTCLTNWVFAPPLA